MDQPSSEDKRATGWFLDSSVDGGRTIQRVRIPSLPFQIGRADESDLVIAFQSVSKHHAELYLEGDTVKVRDKNSTNGTFVKRMRVTNAIVREGDILHIAEFEFQLGRGSVKQETENVATSQTVILEQFELPQHFTGGTRELSELLEKSLTFAVFQPIVTLPEARVVAYEVLGRGLHAELPRSPMELFRIAESAGLEAELSRLFRRKAIELVKQSQKKPPLLFLNTHPSELGKPELVESLEQLRRTAPELELSLEIHEGCVAETKVIAELKTHLDELRIGLAYDDFGMGERFLQLAEVPPDYLKFDISYVKRIVNGAPAERRMLATLMDAAREIKSLCIAEGIESQKEAEVCCSVGFGLAQGYLFCKPMALDQMGPTGAPLEIIGGRDTTSTEEVHFAPQGE